MNKDKAFCEHGIHINIICLQCQAKRQAENKAKQRVYKAAKNLKF